MAISVAAALLALGYAYNKYVKNSHVPVSDTEERPALANLSYHKFYVDEIYDALIRKPLDALSGFLYNTIEKLGIDGIVNGFGKGTIEASKGLRLLQTGNVGFYIFMMVVGIISILLCFNSFHCRINNSRHIIIPLCARRHLPVCNGCTLDTKIRHLF